MSPQQRSTRLICPLTASTPQRMRAEMVAAARQGADTVECRLDYLQTPPTHKQLDALLSGPPVDVIVTCRPKHEGGRFSGHESQRLAVLTAAAALKPAFVDIEMDTPVGHWPDGEIILSHHDVKGPPADLDQIAAELEASPAAVNKIVFAAADPADALRALDLLRSCKKPTIALAMGEAGLVSRILAKKFGAFGTFAALAAGAESAPGQPTLEQIRNLYRWDRIDPDTTVCGVAGCPIAHSMSPAIHNAAFAATETNAVYVPLRIEPGPENFNRFMNALLVRPWLSWRGLSVTIPHKENALAYVGEGNCDDLARKIGAINTITIEPGGALAGENTDYAAAMDALCSGMGIGRDGLTGRAVAVLGAGGAARAIVAALAHYGADVTIYNRTVSRGEKLASEFGCRAAGRDALGALDAEIVINCTPIGMHPDVGATPLETITRAVKVVFDTIYNPVETRLIQQAKQAGLLAIPGLEMFVNQAVAQFEMWAGRPAPREVMSRTAMGKLRG